MSVPKKINIMFTILDDHEHMYDEENKLPIIESIDFTKNAINNFITKTENLFSETFELLKYDTESGCDRQDMVEELYIKHAFYTNYVNKYYVVAYAIDYMRYTVSSKGLADRLIKWRAHDENDETDPILINENQVVYPSKIVDL